MRTGGFCYNLLAVFRLLLCRRSTLKYCYGHACHVVLKYLSSYLSGSFCFSIKAMAST